MIRCKIVNLLLLIPINGMRSYLIQKHTLKCPLCREKLASVSEAKSVLIQENSPGTKINLWPSIDRKLRQPLSKRKSPRFSPKQRSFAAAGFLMLLAAGVFIFYSFFGPHQKLPPSYSGNFQIQHIEVQNKPANTYFYQAPDSNFIFIWAGKN